MNRHLNLCAAVLVVFSVSAYCAMGGMGGGRGGGTRAGGRQTGQSSREAVNTDNLRELLTFGKELDLTDKQAEDIKLIREQSIKDTQAGYEALRMNQIEMSNMLAAPKPDFAGARERAVEVTRAAVNAQAVSIDAYEKAYGLLTDNQKEKLAALRVKLKKERDAENEPPSGFTGNGGAGAGSGRGN